jgi:hypothetical protein
MAKDNVRVLADEVTLYREVGKLTDPTTGEVTGRQNGRGYVAFKGDVVPASEITPDILNALDDEDHPSHEAVSKRLERVSADADLDASAHLGAPFEGYKEMSEEEVVAAMRHLPSATIQRIKSYEEDRENRPKIVGYVIGYGESAVARQEGDKSVVGELGETNEDKTAASLTTREVPDDGPVVPGDGITGTGEPQIPHGSRTEAKSGSKSKRSGRRARPKKSDSGDGEGDSGSSDE